MHFTADFRSRRKSLGSRPRLSPFHVVNGVRLQKPRFRALSSPYRARTPISYARLSSIMR